MKKMKITRKAIFGVLLMVFSINYLSAQTSDATDAGLIQGAGDGVSVRVIDNKGTIKYLQTNNGITSITSTTAANTTTTTWQLGGTLTDDTYIDVDGSVFGLDGIQLVNPATAGAANQASSDATDLSIGSDGSATGTGWTVLIRDEATGETKKIMASDLVATGWAELALATDGDTAIAAVDVSQTLSKVSVYRNGAKLRAGTDYTLATDQVTLTPGGTAPNDWATLAGDLIEVHWIN